ncbi:MAG: ribonuclease Y [Clostridia bacterium]|nr:ribonuclease Y [Clostridia bacterium]
MVYPIALSAGQIIIPLVAALVTLVIGSVVGFFGGIQYRKKIAEAEIGSAEQEAAKIREEGGRVAETLKKEALLEAKEEIVRQNREFEKEVRDRRSELTRLENRCVTREEQLDRKLEQLEHKDQQLDRKLKENDKIRQDLEALKAERLQKLETIAGYTAEQAKAEIVSEIEEEARHDAAERLVEIERALKEDADDKAKNIMSLAIARLASDHVSEATVSVVPLPNDDMKGRIIGREGRNIRTVETLTGVDLIIDDTPEAITLSSFDPVRREVARLALEKLIADGRIHPTRIEEMVEKAKKEVEVSIKQAGDRATFETGIHGIPQDLVRLLGRLRYRTSYGQNVLDHSIEVSLLSGMLADELGVDSTVAKRAGLLHDIGKALTHETEGSHVHIGVDVAKKYKESRDVVHAIEAHHGDVEPKTVIALIVKAADAISAARPGARRENLENYIKRLQKLEEIANSFPGVDSSFAIQAGREIRILVKPEMVSDQDMLAIARDIVKQIESELKYPGQIKVHVVRESRVVDYAK